MDNKRIKTDNNIFTTYYAVNSKKDVTSLSIELNSRIFYHRRTLTEQEGRRINNVLYQIMDSISYNDLNILDINSSFSVVDLSDTFVEKANTLASLKLQLFLSNDNLTFKLKGKEIEDDVRVLIGRIIRKLDDLTTLEFRPSKG